MNNCYSSLEFLLLLFGGRCNLTIEDLAAMVAGDCGGKNTVSREEAKNLFDNHC
ncbi:unnamed protein product [Brassica oleracea]